jgi:U3 small nucleolar RNA-associated protein MPP10
MTPAEKKTLHNKARKTRKKQNEAIEKLKDSRGKSKMSVKQQKEEALKSVVKNGKGVTVVGKGAPTNDKRKGKPRQS